MHSALGCIHFTLGATTQQKPVENITKQAVQNNYHNLSVQKARKPLACARFKVLSSTWFFSIFIVLPSTQSKFTFGI